MFDNFEDFWATYGRIGNKKQAEKAYNKAIKRVSHDEIIRGVTEYQAQEHSRGTERKYYKHASTWLNNDGWADEYTVDTQERKLTVNDKITIGFAKPFVQDDERPIFYERVKRPY